MPTDPTLYLYTSLTAGSSHIITATSRIETILKANKIPFKAVDCATDDKARMLWQRRSKGKKIPGLVKFADVIADLETVEDWNEHGELEDQIEDQIDIFGDVPISATSAEAQAAAQKTRESMMPGRTASETRHISISDPKGDARKQSATEENPAGNLGVSDKKDSPLNMAMRQAGAEAAAKAGQKQLSPSETQSKTAAMGKEPTDASTPAPTATSTSSLESGVEEVTKVETGAKTPAQLASQGQSRTSVDKLAGGPEDDDSTKSNIEQILDQKRKSSVPQTASSLSKTTSIDQSHTVTSSEDVENDSLKPSSRPDLKEHRGSSVDTSASKADIKKIEKANAIAEENEDEDDDREPGKTAMKVGATDKQEEKVLGSSKPQEQDAADPDEAGKSVGD